MNLSLQEMVQYWKENDIKQKPLKFWQVNWLFDAPKAGLFPLITVKYKRLLSMGLVYLGFNENSTNTLNIKRNKKLDL